MIPRIRFIFLAAALLVAIPSTWARASGEEAIPAPLDKNRYTELWEASPFQRQLNAADSYCLTSVSSIGGKPVVTLLNTATGERYTLSTESNAQGWKLVDLQPDENPKNILARIRVNGEVVTVRFNEGQLSTQALLKAAGGPGPQLAPGPGVQNNRLQGIQGAQPQEQGKHKQGRDNNRSKKNPQK